MDRTVKMALGSVAVGLVVFGLKLLAFWLTGSVALYSDALESIINIVAAGVALLVLSISARPADANHPYGHHKAEYFSAVLEGVLIVLAALAILREAWFGLLDPRPLAAPIEGLALNGLASAINAGWSWLLLSRGRRWRSPALIADGLHVRADVVTSVGVLVGVALVALTGWLVLDPLLAAAVALNILWSGWQMVRESVGGLMDEAASPEIQARIQAAIAQHGGGALQAHDLRTRHAGQSTFIEFHLVVPAEMRVAEAHAICDRIETGLRDELEGAMIAIHVEPEEKAKEVGAIAL